MKLKEKSNSVLKNVMNQLIQEEFDGWPPSCPGIVHQPLRPKAVLDENDEIKEEE